MSPPRPGTLYLVPSPLGDVPPEAVLPSRTIEIARSLAHWVAENAKSARGFIASLHPVRPVREIAIEVLDEHTPPDAVEGMLAPLMAGHDLGLVSEAGCPAVADPGAALVAAAHASGLRVVPLVGPSALLLALMASGLNGQGFAFHGYLPVKPEERLRAIRALEAESARTGRAQLFIETPYRNVALLRALLAACRPGTRLAVAADLTTASESVASRTIAQWRGDEPARWAKRPAMFVLQA